jgi:hypothetical protein
MVAEEIWASWNFDAVFRIFWPTLLTREIDWAAKLAARNVLYAVAVLAKASLFWEEYVARSASRSAGARPIVDKEERREVILFT